MEIKNRILACLLCAVMLSGCAATDDTTTGEATASDTPAVDMDTAGNTESGFDLEVALSKCAYIDATMYENATAFKEGDLTRLAAVFRKAEQGEGVTVGVIGGSITQGSQTSSLSKCYASLLETWWAEQFPDSEITLVNAGVGGTTSYLGVHRVEEDLLFAHPDFVVVEFSVNDSTDPFYKKSYDNLVRRILQQENEPAVLLLFMTQENGTSAQANDASIGFQYGLPMISYREAVLQAIEDGKYTWTDISPDNIHPNDRGHQMTAELIGTYLESVYAKRDEIPKEVTPFTTKPVTREVYQDATILYNEDIEPDNYGSFEKADINYHFPGNWYTESGEESICFTVEAQNIGILYQMFKDGSGGQYEVYVDGEYVMTLDADFSDGWGDYSESQEVFVDDEKKIRTVELRKKEDSTGDAFALLGLMIS